MNLPGGPAPDHSSEPSGPAGSNEPTGTAPVDRRRIDEIFGDVLPDVTGDERDAPRAFDAAADDDRWYLDNRPPHHG